MSDLQHILDHQIVAILRGMPPKEIIPIAKALYNGGIRILEITLNSQDALPVIEQLSHAFKDRMLIGAGTVLNTTDANNAIDAGAKFLISPSLDVAVIKTAKDAGLVSIPGAFTPTEILSAHNNGADIVKIFPCLDAAYIKNILAPLNHIRVMPTGGIDASNIKTFAATGAVAFGIGSALVNSKVAINETYLAELSAKARRLIEALKE
ncbi:bifunctional 4-hydroxy-2-oxoglutarate aldolase/2-dehydro-3-deoxy-phosphogluconate aldolase [Panacibacter ginsenosidivorans]|uniref:Bifunctional 4-hydroxy-2-oxoglutarate aldolase/2-dehydro-3-deoxy-phosphogluconate aldolase n=1 Tax=Panacibacter ginsenosidivorans TaxID=1813871 RepID=A0A5B8V797_9BACT|nr:bifunctional 4-hydroxy-2-oxoglutarate aldolase/2-dehydro-3-deoxy-phosphogluconate aldolase [Panacibacter ginsenosidivorans]QEC66651.1 bifunctional 4-hydroxy-2-oxoglutarate aldolase/2-dehydro-3-deoxy-phosphogluconate aldolase [Panacibacter ginsenosidivorans]